MTEQKSDNSLKSVQKMTQEYWLREQKKDITH